MTVSKAVVLAQPRRPAHPRSAPRRSCTSLPPAALLPLANRALLGHALDWLSQAGVREAPVVVPHELAASAGEAVTGRRSALRVCWAEQSADESLAHALGDLTGFLDGEPFVLHLADSLAKQSLRSLTAGWAECESEVYW